MDNSADDFDGNFQRYASNHKVSLEERMLDSLFIETCENEEMNSAITIDEIRRLVSRTKNGKSFGIDNIPYEVLKTENVITVLHSLLQLVFDTSIVPLLWHLAIICPIVKDKSSDKRIPLHYRGISLLSCISKLYCGFINNRLSSYLEDNDLLSEEQNGFRKNRSCEDDRE
ncbi:unnamed protein product [Mytilus coruscus]|uniref:Reverse transcriptase domain-containing protein n=1 Tax=Mytilus coruscus TaxID=42192 RepID=A0A6J8EZ79_MYTCO|nr:unnamed protein product [Mytilus coruscus]